MKMLGGTKKSNKFAVSKRALEHAQAYNIFYLYIFYTINYLIKHYHGIRYYRLMRGLWHMSARLSR
jgi:hypothetical protein